MLMAFFFTMPMSKMTPMRAMMLKSVLKSSSASSAPTHTGRHADLEFGSVNGLHGGRKRKKMCRCSKAVVP